MPAINTQMEISLIYIHFQNGRNESTNTISAAYPSINTKGIDSFGVQKVLITHTADLRILGEAKQ